MRIKRLDFLARLKRALSLHPVVAVLGPRQCGKTTLALDFIKTFKGPSTHLDLEDPVDLLRLENPKLALEALEGLVVIDEIQRRPELFPVLRVLADRRSSKTKFLILGSASGALLSQSSETLAGRLGMLELTPFSSLELSKSQQKNLWLRGGFPDSLFARSAAESLEWRKYFIRTFLEQDIPNLGIKIPAAALRRFWLMLAHFHGQRMNFSDVGRSLGIADTTVRRYLDILSGTFMLRQLAPWFENISKRQVKAPKVFFRDSGIFHSFLGLGSDAQLKRHPQLGASWEGFAIEEIIRFHRADESEVFYWATHADAELDLLIVKDGKRIGYEIKYADAPKLKRSQHVALNDLKLDELILVYPGTDEFKLGPKIWVRGLENFQRKS